MQEKPPLLYKYPPPDPEILLNITNSLLKSPEFYIKVLHLMNFMDLPVPFHPCKTRFRYLSKAYQNHKFILNSHKIDPKKPILPISALLDEEIDPLVKKDFLFLCNDNLQRVFNEIIIEISKKSIDFFALYEKINLFKLVFDKEAQERYHLYNKLINQIDLEEVIEKKPRGLTEKELNELEIEKNEKMRKIIGNKRKFDVYIDVFNERNIKHNEEYCFFKGNVLKNDKFDIFYDNSFMKQPNFHLNDYKGDLTPFLPKNQAFNQKQPLIEEENDLFFDENIQKTYKKIEKSPNNRFSKHFLDLNRCSLSEIEVINKGKYDPGQKSKGLYIKNLHPKAKFLLFCLKSNIFLDFIYFCS